MTYGQFVDRFGNYFNGDCDSLKNVEGYAKKMSDGKMDWHYKSSFEELYTKCTELPFSRALDLVKMGSRVTRQDWMDQGMFIVYQKGYPEGIPCNRQTADAWGLQEGNLFKCNPYLQIRQADGSHSMWTPSMDDLMAEDWMLLEEA